ncbi:MAG: hypothetical protein F6K31_44290 [Symploca sp. SIO2G7]|nr:hypothetical protein [Symploca sp. SIO2G7]
MSDWKWFLRVALLGFIGTVVLSQVFSSILEQNKSYRSLALAITPQEVKTQTDLPYPSESLIIPEDSVPLFPSKSFIKESISTAETPLPTLPLTTPQDIPTLEKPLPPLPPIPQLETPTLRQRFSLPSSRNSQKRSRQFSASSTHTSQTPVSASPTHTPKAVFPQLKHRLSVLSKPDSYEEDNEIADALEQQSDNNPAINNRQKADKTNNKASCLPSSPDSCPLEPVSEESTNTLEETSQELPSKANQEVISTSLDKEANLDPYSALFATPVSLGMVAIGVAEGNYRLFIKDGNLYVEKTSLYFGHTDPGNLSWGEVVTNYGPCSDQGRSKGNLAIAEQLCLQRSLSQLPTHLADLQAVGIDPHDNIEALLNTADLYNQANQIHSRRFPEALIWASLTGQTGVEAIAWARTASFYLNEHQEIDFQQGENKATGLLGICARERQPITEWQCVYRDQLRRTQAIATVLDTYRQVSQVEETRETREIRELGELGELGELTEPHKGRFLIFC